MPGGGNAFIIEAFALLGVALTIIFLRTVARATSVGVKKFQLDDYMMLVAGVSHMSRRALILVLTEYRSYIPWRLPRRTSLEPGGRVLPTMA